VVELADGDHFELRVAPVAKQIGGATVLMLAYNGSIPGPTLRVRTGEVIDIVLDVTNPGRWMAHCHIAEHHESGMMFSFDVER
jgi:FtsP/CotA-like multicopper oxidase with cupredoxin domain